MRKRIWAGPAAVALLLGAQVAGAASFDFTGLGGVPSNDYMQSDAGITVTVSAPGEDLGYLSLDGFGVKTGLLNLAALQDGEVLEITFSETVTVGSVLMRQWEGPDDVILTANTGAQILYGPDSCALCTGETIDTSSLGALDSFTIEGDGLLTATLLAGMGGVEAVPEPGLLGLLGLGAGLGAARRARR